MLPLPGWAVLLSLHPVWLLPVKAGRRLTRPRLASEAVVQGLCQVSSIKPTAAVTPIVRLASGRRLSFSAHHVIKAVVLKWVTPLLPSGRWFARGLVAHTSERARPQPAPPPPAAMDAGQGSTFPTISPRKSNHLAASSSTLRRRSAAARKVHVRARCPGASTVMA